MKKILNINLKSILIASLLLTSVTIFAQKGDANEFENSIVISADDKDLQWGPCPSFMPDGCNIAVLHGDPAKPNVDVLFKIAADYEIPNHWHNSAERMILLSGELHVTYKGETTQIIKAGSYAFGPSKKPHTGKCVSKDPCILFIAFEYPLDAFATESK